jgi:hypothetical protein
MDYNTSKIIFDNLEDLNSSSSKVYLDLIALLYNRSKYNVDVKILNMYNIYADIKGKIMCYNGTNEEEGLPQYFKFKVLESDTWITIYDVMLDSVDYNKEEDCLELATTVNKYV